MNDQKFKVGQTVSYLSGSRGGGWRSDVFKIMQCLPPQDGDYQYRIDFGSRRRFTSREHETR
jgi:hypothetical protein